MGKISDSRKRINFKGKTFEVIKMNEKNNEFVMTPLIYKRLMKFGNSLSHFSSEFMIIKTWKPIKDIVEVEYWKYHIDEDNYSNVGKFVILFRIEVINSDINMVKLYIQYRLNNLLNATTYEGLRNKLNFRTTTLEKLKKEREIAKSKYTAEYLEKTLTDLNRKIKSHQKDVDSVSKQVDIVTEIVESDLDKFKISKFSERFYLDHYCDRAFQHFENYDFYKEKGE